MCVLSQFIGNKLIIEYLQLCTCIMYVIVCIPAIIIMTILYMYMYLKGPGDT